jgi:hypothetical protein
MSAHIHGNHVVPGGKHRGQDLQSTSVRLRPWISTNPATPSPPKSRIARGMPDEVTIDSVGSVRTDG